MKACPYRRNHEWEWDGSGQFWLCVHCYARTGDPNGTPLVEAVRQVVETMEDSERPTPSEPFPALPQGLTVGARAVLTCSVAGCDNPGRIVKVSGTRWSTRCLVHQ